MIQEQSNPEKLANALKRLAYFEELSDDCKLYVEGEDGSLRELLANSPETGGEDTEPLKLGHLRELFSVKKASSDQWAAAWDKFDGRV